MASYRLYSRTLLLFAVWCLLAFLPCHCTAETEVQWTANEAGTAEGSSGPLPLSMQQRKQLLQLEDVIRNSPNPEETLRQAADANGMDPRELASMLQRDRFDFVATCWPIPVDPSHWHRRLVGAFLLDWVSCE